PDCHDSSWVAASPQLAHRVWKVTPDFTVEGVSGSSINTHRTSSISSFGPRMCSYRSRYPKPSLRASVSASARVWNGPYSARSCSVESQAIQKVSLYPIPTSVSANKKGRTIPRVIEQFHYRDGRSGGNPRIFFRDQLPK